MSFKLSIGRDISSGNRGMSNFMRQLVISMSEQYKVQLVDVSQKSDIHLSIISGIKKGSKNIVRIDGVYYDVPRLKQNDTIRKTIQAVDGVVFQSNWSKEFVTKMLKVKPRSSAVVYNGVDQKSIKTIAPIDSPFDKSFVCCAHWRPNKRLEAIVGAFRQLLKRRPDLNIGLFIIGKLYDNKLELDTDTNVRLFGNVSPNSVYSILKASNWMVHVCHIDSCPNSVIEGLSVGLPVVCNNIGGTPEIVGNDGVVVQIDKPFKFSAIENMALVGSSSVDVSLLSKGMEDCLQFTKPVTRKDLDINSKAESYYEFMKQVLGR